jgi:hypothetical protein
MGETMRASLMFSVMLVAACSNEGEPGSCYRDHDNACVDYGRPQGAAGKRMCSGMKWTSGEKSCPTANRIGACTKQSGTEWLYSGAPNNYNASSAKSACEFGGGVFTPAPVSSTP